MTNIKSGRKKILNSLITIIILIIASLLGINVFPTGDDEVTVVESTGSVEDAISESTEGELILHMIDVGQADSFLLVQDDKTALIDCGTTSSGKDVVKYLKDLGITELDYVFGTHPHEDHMGGMYDVITNFEIGKVIIPEVEEGKVTTNWYIKLMNELNNGGQEEEKKGYEVEYVELGEIYYLNEAEMKVIGPISKMPSNGNNYSTVLKVSFGEMDIIMTGDAETKVEKEIIQSGEDIDAEILKVGHHGSDTSSSEEFLDAITPEYALISSGMGNQHEHPIKSTMEKLEERNISVYRTDESGSIVVTITTDDVSFSCEPGDYLSGIELKERSTK